MKKFYNSPRVTTSTLLDIHNVLNISIIGLDYRPISAEGN